MVWGRPCQHISDPRSSQPSSVTSCPTDSGSPSPCSFDAAVRAVLQNCRCSSCRPTPTSDRDAWPGTQYRLAAPGFHDKKFFTAISRKDPRQSHRRRASYPRLRKHSDTKELSLIIQRGQRLLHKHCNTLIFHFAIQREDLSVDASAGWGDGRPSAISLWFNRRRCSQGLYGPASPRFEAGKLKYTKMSTIMHAEP